jgi:ribonuclease HII
MNNRGVVPTSIRERELHNAGIWPIAGVDEAGRGALAGPVVAGAVVADWLHTEPWHEGVRDSKQLSRSARERLYDAIIEGTLAVGVGVVPNSEIDRIGIAAASRYAMLQALEALAVVPRHVLIDWFTLPALRIGQEGVPGGDARCLSIACASIIAKVVRDRMMDEMDREYSAYGFAAHKGYGTVAHLRLLRENGVSPVHRMSFRPVRLVAGGLL